MDERLGDAYDESLRKIARLEETNGALCAEINRQERRIRELESLVRDMYAEWLATVDDYYAQSVDGYYERMAELGIES